VIAIKKKERLFILTNNNDPLHRKQNWARRIVWDWCKSLM